MAFTTELTIRGRTYPAAYVNIDTVQAYTTNCICKLRAWEDQAARVAGIEPLPWYDNVAEFVTTDLTAANPIAYAYAQLEASGQFPEATWNV